MPGKSENNALSVEQLSVNYEKTAVLFDLNFSIPAGCFVGIMGPNGAGKSTLLKAVMGLVEPLSGKVDFFQKPLSEVRKQVAYIPQRSSVDWDFPLTAFDLVQMGSYGRLGMLKWLSKKEKKATLRALEMVGMEGFRDRQIGELSGGQQQRLFIARALLQEADIYLLDEPFAGVDLATEKAIFDIFSNLQKEGKTVIVVHHDLANAREYFDWIILLNTCLIASGPTAEVFSEQNLLRTYGRSAALLAEAAKMAKDKALGL